MAAEVRIIVSQTASGSAIKDTEKDIESLGKTAKESGGGFSALREIGIGALRELGAAATNAALGGLKALAGAIGEGITDAREAAKINAQTEATIKSMGNVAGVTSQHVQDFAASLSAAAGKSLFGDSQIQESTNLLLTFSEIKGSTLDLATVLTTDLAQALGGAPRDHAMMLGKALNDPIKGITALGKAGLTFSQEQKDVIRALVETGDIAGAQKIILEELNKQVGGSAAAAAAADGGWAQFNDRMGEAKETMGAAVLPLLGILAGFLNDQILPVVESTAAAFADWLANPETQAGIQVMADLLMGGVGQAMAFIGSIIAPLITEVRLFAETWGIAGEFTSGFLEQLGGTIDLLIGAEGTFQDFGSTITSVFSDSRTPLEGFINVLSQVSPTFALVRAMIEAALPPIRDIILTVFGIIQGFIAEHGQKIRADLTSAWQQIQAIIEQITPPIQAIISAIFGNIALFLHTHGDDIKAFLGQTWDAIAEIINLALQLIQATLVPALQFIAGFISSHGAEIQAILNTVWENIKGVITIAIALVKGILQTGLALIKGDWQGAWDAIKTMVNTVWETIKTMLTTNLEILKTLLLGAWTYIKDQLFIILNGIAGNIYQMMLAAIGTITSLGVKLAEAAAGVGNNIVSGIVSGINNGASAILNAARDAAMAALNAAKSALGIGSPSRVFAESVGLPMAQGMAVGLMSGVPLVTGAAQTVAGAAVGGATSNTRISNFTYAPSYASTPRPSMDAAMVRSIGGAV